ncbi:thioesterase domain-containing protein, partial [Massilia sp. BJB1822]|uniref:thioesterase domain-containing protein n=1 Tax=Massilia sp. BJB1822 TaxID=2744470 RepID=UPI0015938546
VAIYHAGLNNYLRWAMDAYRAAELKNSIVSSPLAFDATITSLYLPLLAGKQMWLLPSRNEVECLEQLLASGDSWGLIKITPAHLAVLGQSLRTLNRKPSVDLFVVGGEALPVTTVALWKELCPTARIINEYGPTETVVGCITYEPAGDDDLGTNVPIGRPIANTQIYILDQHGEPAPLGVAGEIHIGGAGVARGYLNRPELTAERFITDPFSAERGARLYKTGDLGRWLADGNIEYLGRNDFQVKVRGFRIELGEIEAALAACAGVGEAVVIAREDQPGDKRLVAYLTAQQGAVLEPATLRSALMAQLPDYMVPAGFVTLAAYPLTPNGKLDRKALPAPDQGAMASRAFEAPQGEREQILAQLWEELLGVERVGRYDNFFELGGHSLLAVQVISRISDLLGIQMPMRQLFVHPTLATLAAAVLEEEASRCLVPLRPHGRQAPLFLIHPAGGDIGYAQSLSRWLPDDVPVYGVAAAGLAPGESPLPSIELMAARYVSELRSIAPEGPYRIAGYSDGGIVAFEMARQLSAAKQDVAFVGLIDTYYYDADGAGEPPHWSRAAVAANWLALPESHPLAHALEQLARMDDLQGVIQLAREHHLIASSLRNDLIERYLDVYQAFRLAVRRHQVGMVALPVTYFATAEARRGQTIARWSAACQHQLAVADVPGDHLTMMKEPNIQFLADRLFAGLGGLNVPATITENCEGL